MSALARRCWAAPLWAHALAYGVLLLVLLPLARPGTVFTPDEGSYGLQVRDLEGGEWAHDYRAAGADPRGLWFPVGNATRSEEGWFVYVQHPAYPLLLRGSAALLGDPAGLYAVPMAGALLAAVAAWLLAGEVGGRLRRPAFWLAAGSPVLVNATVLWGHTLSAAAAGFALWGVLRLRRRVEPVAVLALAAGVAGGVLLRSEGLLLALALAVGVAWGWRAQWRRGAVVAVAVAALGGAAALAEHEWVSSIIGGPFDARGLRQQAAGDSVVSEGSSLVAGRVQGLWHVLAGGAYDRPALTGLLVPALVLVPFAALALRRRRDDWWRDFTVWTGAVAVLYAVRFAVDLDQAATGLLVAWPVVLAGIVLYRRPGHPTGETVLGVTVLAFAAAVFATQYDIGGGLEWGARFLSPALPALAVLLAAGLTRSLDLVEDADRRRSAAIVLAGLAVVPSLLGVAVVGAYRSANHSLVREVRAAAVTELVVTHELILPRAAWRSYPETGWMLVEDAVGDTDQLALALEAALAAGFRDVTLVVPFFVEPADLGPYRIVEELTGPEVGRFGWRTLLVST